MAKYHSKLKFWSVHLKLNGLWQALLSVYYEMPFVCEDIFGRAGFEKKGNETTSRCSMLVMFNDRIIYLDKATLSQIDYIRNFSIKPRPYFRSE